MSINQGTFDHSKLADPRVVGPGGWKTLHLLAVWDDMNGQKVYPSFNRFYCERFKCKECGGHCNKFLEKYPPEKRVGEEWGMSRHSWELHNAANRALHKPQLPWEEFVELFIKEGKGVCQAGCADNGKAKSNMVNQKVSNYMANQKVSKDEFKKLERLSYEDETLVVKGERGRYKR